MIDRRSFVARSLAGSAAVASLGPAAFAAAQETVPGDMAVIRGALALHPGLYRYNSPQQVEDQLALLDRALATAADRAQAFLALQRFLSGIRCGHTRANAFNQSRAVAADLFDRPTRLPFRFAWMEGRMIVLGDESGTGAFVPGTEIISVNGVMAGDMLARLLPYTSADGHNDGKRASQLAMRNTVAIEYFDVFHGLLFPPDGATHAITYRPFGGTVRDGVFPALSLEARRASRQSVTPAADNALWTWTMQDDIAVLTMPTWAVYNTNNWDWRAWLDERLSSLGGARGLIVDIRQAEGGNPCGDAILSRLVASDLVVDGYRQRVRFRRTPAWLDPYMETWDASFRSMGEGAEDVGEGFFELREQSDAASLIRAVAPQVTVPVAVLVSPVCSSATFAFARKAQQTGLVRLFGEETGGNMRGINGERFFFVRLPDCGLEFDLPLVGHFAGSSQSDAGVRPDVAVSPTVADVAGGHDPVLAAAQAWLGRA